MRRDDPEVQRVPVEGALPAPPEAIIGALAPLITARRLERIRAVAALRTTAVIPVLESLADPHNASAILRSADALGLQEVHVVEHPGGFFAAHRVSKGADRWLDLVVHEQPEACVHALEERGYEVVVASAEGTLRPEDLSERPRLALVLGHERTGPSDAIRERAHGTVSVPMVGFVESLNVSVAAAILLYAATRGRPPNLSEAERERLVARYLFNSVRDAERVLRERGVMT